MISWVVLKLLSFNISNCRTIKNSVGQKKAWWSCSSCSWGHTSVGQPFGLESCGHVGNLEIDYVIRERIQSEKSEGPRAWPWEVQICKRQAQEEPADEIRKDRRG